MIRRPVLSIILVVLLIIPLRVTAKHDPIYSKLTVPLLFSTQLPRDIEHINDAVNAITRVKIGAEIELVPLLSFTGENTDLRRQAELALLEKEGVVFDLINESNNGQKAYKLDELLDQYGQGILQVIGEERLKDYREPDGSLYRLPPTTEYAYAPGIAMLRDIIDKHGIDVSEIHTYEDLDQLFTTLRELEPNLSLICDYSTGQAFNSRHMRSRWAQSTFFCQSPEDPMQLINYFGTDEYREIIGYARKWYLAGYTPPDMALQNLNASNLVRAGELFSFFSVYKPSAEFEIEIECAQQMVIIPLSEPTVSPSGLYRYCWGISKDCLNPGKALQFLDLLYTDSDLVTLLLYGIENDHYIVLADSTIAHAEGVNHDNTGYFHTMPWTIPNPMISYVWTGNDVDLWRRAEAFNQSAKRSALMGFRFDDSAVHAKHAAVNAVVQRYFYGLGSGQLDPDVYLPKMLDEMENAGLSDVACEIQNQFAAWHVEG